MTRGSTETWGESGASPKRFHQLDGLRAVAALLVVIHHAGAAMVADTLISRGHRFIGTMLRSGTAGGVELFFVLSGVVLLRPYLRGTRRLDPLDYVARRAQRLWPPFVAAWVFCGVVIFIASRHPTWWSRGAGLPDFTYSGWLAQGGIIYFGNGAFNFAWWSLTVEVLFYLVVPLIVSGHERGRSWKPLLPIAICTSVVVALVVANAPAHWPIGMMPLRNFLLYGPCFAGGILLARYDLPQRAGWLALLSGGAWCAAAFKVAQLNVHIGWALLFTGVVSIALRPNSAARWLSAWPMVWLGERSYSLFLVHYAVFSATCYAVSRAIGHKGALYFAVTRALEIPLALLVAMMIFHFVERRFARNLVTGNSFWPGRTP